MDDDSANTKSRRDLLSMLINFTPAFALAALVLYPHLAYFRQTTEDEPGAVAAYLSACVMIAGGWAGLVFVMLHIARYLRQLFDRR